MISSANPVTLVGGSEVTRRDIDEVLTLAPNLVAADGGANTLDRFDLTPLAVFGDMDSIAPEAAARYADLVHKVEEQDSIDFDKALRRVALFTPHVLA